MMFLLTSSNRSNEFYMFILIWKTRLEKKQKSKKLHNHSFQGEVAQLSFVYIEIMNAIIIRKYCMKYDSLLSNM